MRRDSGLWKGTVTVDDGYQTPYSCTAEMDISHNDQDLIIHHIANTCFAYGSKWHTGRFELFGSSVWKNGRNVGSAHHDGSGSLELDELTMDERYPHAATTVRISWRRSGIGLDFTEQAYSGGRVVRTTGWLKKIR